MPKYRVVVESPGLQESYDFEADNLAEAEELGRDIFFDICNYGVTAVTEDDD